MRKKDVQLYFGQRNPLFQQNQQYSTVYEINPTLESQESMLQKIIYANNEQKSKGSISMNKFHKKAYQFQPNIYENQIKQMKRPIQQKIISTKYKYLGQQPYKYLGQQSYIQVSKKNLAINQSNPRKTSQSLQLHKRNNIKNIQNQYQSKGIDSRVDQQKLKRIQNKINQYRKVGPTTDRLKKQPFGDITNQNQQQFNLKQSTNNKLNMKNLQHQTIANRTERRPSLITLSQNDNYSFGLKVDTKDLPQTSINKQSKLNHFLEQTYYCLTNDNRKLCPQYCNFKNLPFEEIKFILGSIFTDIFIRNKTFTKQQFLTRSLSILKEYDQQQTNTILKIFKLDQEEKTNHLRRKTGLVLKNSKKNPTQSKYKPTMPSEENFCISKPSKNAYITITHPDQLILPSYQKQHLYQTPLQTMYDIQRNRKITYQRVDRTREEWEGEDDQLKRLEGLEARFQLHFTQRK